MKGSGANHYPRAPAPEPRCIDIGAQPSLGELKDVILFLMHSLGQTQHLQHIVKQIIAMESVVMNLVTLPPMPGSAKQQPVGISAD